MYPFQVGSTAGRPVLAAVEAVASQWIHQVLDTAVADEYFTAFELDGDVEPGADDEPAPSTPAGPSAANLEVQQLRDRLQQLEQRMSSSGPAAVVGAPAESAAMMFGGDRRSSPLSSVELQRLQIAAGPAPKRLGRAEGSLPAPQPALESLEQITEAEADREVGELEALPEPSMPELQAAMSQVADPVQKMLMAQLHQTTQLVKALTPKQQPDPIAAILGGSDSASASASSGVAIKGYAAREMFLKQLIDDRKLVATIRQHAARELGIAEDRTDGSLLRTYLEHRIPVSDRKSLIQFGYMLAWGWEAGHQTNNLQLQAFAGRMMLYIEQCALDDGRSNLAWLLTGLPEPNFQQLSLNRKRTTLTPFSKLAPPAWIAANISYLRDVELFETRLKQLTPGGKGQTSTAQASSDTEEKPRAKAKPKGKRPKGGKGAEAPPSDATNA